MSENFNQFFIKLENWQFQHFNPQVGIIDPENHAYTIPFQADSRNKIVNLEIFNALLKDPQVSQLKALTCHIGYNDGYPEWSRNNAFGVVLEALCDACDRLSNLQALFIGDGYQHEYRKSKLAVFDIRPILEAFPNLQLLQVCGHFYKYLLECESLKHENLKTLIIETADISGNNFAQICSLELPNLECLELWLGRQLDLSKFVRNMLKPIFCGEKFPNLAYLGLRSSECSDLLAIDIVQSSIMERLLVLDLSMGNLSDRGAQALLNCPAINQLHTLNISNNCVSEGMVQRLLQLNCQVIAYEQESEVHRGGGASRYSALHE